MPNLCSNTLRTPRGTSFLSALRPARVEGFFLFVIQSREIRYTRYMKKSLIAAVSFMAFILVLVNPSAPSAHACSCMMPEPPQESLAKSEAVFSGKVTSVKSDTDMQQVIAIDVTNIWKGVSSSKIAITTPRDSAACGVNFETGKEYLVYAYSDEDGSLATNLCSRTHEITANDEDVKALGKGNPVETPTSTPVTPSASEEAMQLKSMLTTAAIISLLIVAVGGFILVLKKKA